MQSSAHMLLENRTGSIQRAFVDGAVHQLMPYEVKSVTNPIGGAFLEQRSGFVIRYVGAHVPAPAPWEKVTWIANATGNPFLPEEVTLTRYKKGDAEEYSIPNPLRTPTVVTRTFRGGMKWQKSPKDIYSEESINLPGGRIELPPYTRVPIAYALGEWMLRRDSQQQKQHIGRVVPCRAPTDYEPNAAWSLPQLRFYATNILDVPEGMVADFVDSQDELITAANKCEILNLMFFRLIDIRWNLPDKTTWETVWNNRGTNLQTEETVNAEKAKAKAFRERVRAAKAG